MSRKISVAFAIAALGSAMLGTVTAHAGPIPVKPVPVKPLPVKPLPIKPIGPVKPVIPPIGPIKPLPPKLPPAPLPPIVVTPPPHAPGIVIVEGRPVYQPVAVSAPVRNACICLTKDYTPVGVVIFKDLCTKETATTVVPGSPAARALEAAPTLAPAAQSSDAAPAQSFAGKSYEQFIAGQQAAKQN